MRIVRCTARSNLCFKHQGILRRPQVSKQMHVGDPPTLIVHPSSKHLIEHLDQNTNACNCSPTKDDLPSSSGSLQDVVAGLPFHAVCNSGGFCFTTPGIKEVKWLRMVDTQLGRYSRCWLYRNFECAVDHSSCWTRGQVMTHASAPVEAPVDVPKEAFGFKLLRQEFVNEYNSEVAIYEHEKSGAQLMSVMNDDENKTFSAAYRTPVSNSKGIPHILEHSVLGGSRKYPVKEPFLELIKGSLHTFINAMTYPDRTLYPVASCNLQDFYNLVDVYLDAIHYPRCLTDRQIFEQEGWHHDLNSTDENVSFKGVVYNEMKGVYSSADQTNYRVAVQSIFPNNHLQHDSGGDPEAIPDLTYEEFKAFHDSFYHPCNGKYFFYGNDPPLERLKLLSAYLDDFEKKSVDSKVDIQPLLKEPRTVVRTYAAGEQEDKCFVSLNWLLSEEPFQSDEEMAMGFLDFLLIGTQASPMYKALTDSGLGESVAGLGIEDDLNQPFLGIGLKGVKEADAEKVESVIMEEFKRLAKEGFSVSALDAAFNTIEFSLRENNTGRFPRGLSFWTSIMGRWNYDRDPLLAVKWEAPLEHLKKRLASGEDVFGPLIQKYILDNPHRVTVKLEPDKDKSTTLAKAEESRLKNFQASLTTEQLSNVVADTKSLKKKQETLDSPEALKCIPSLELSDIPTEISKIPRSIDQEAGATFLSHDLFTNNILYLQMILELRTVPERLIPLLPLFCESLTQLGTKNEDFVQLTERIGRKTGSLSFSPFISSQEGSRDPVAKLFVAGKATKDKVGDMTELMREILTTVVLDNPERFKQLVLETVSGLESGIVSSGNRFAALRLSAQFSAAGYANELMGGYSYLEFTRNLLDRVTNDWNGVLKDLTELHTILLNRKDAIINMTGDEGTMSSSRPHVIGLLDGLPSKDFELAPWSALLPRKNEALTAPTQVNYVGKTVNLLDTASFQYSGSLEVIGNYVNTGWLWERVRALGGAYGCSMSFDRLSGNLGFTSYRDPNITNTLDCYDATGDFLRKVDLDRDNLTKTIIGTMSRIDQHQLADAKGMSSLTRYLLGITDEKRQLIRDQVLSTSLKDFHSMAEYFDQVKGDSSSVVAITSPEASKELLEKNPGFWDPKKVL